MATGPTAPLQPTLPGGCYHRWKEQEEPREAEALPSSVGVTPLRPPKACVPGEKFAVGPQAARAALALVVSWAL